MNTNSYIKGFLSSGSSYWDRFWFTPFPERLSSIFRIVHGGALLAFLLAWWKNGSEWLSTAGFHTPNELTPPLDPSLLPIFGVFQFGLLILFIAGWQVRVMAGLSWLCFLYVTLVDRVSAYSINSIFLFSLAVFTLFPTKSKNASIPIAPVRLLQLAMVAIYFSSGWHKAVFGDWLDSPHVLEASIQGIYMTDFAAWALRTMPAFVWPITQYAVLAFELFSPVLFFSRQLRIYGIIAGCVFHLGIALFMDQLIYFSLQMMSFYILFLPQEIWKNLRASCAFQGSPSMILAKITKRSALL